MPESVDNERRNAGGSCCGPVAGMPVTLLYSPAARPELMRKALAGDADVVVVDLEDAVAASAKAQARDTAHDVLQHVSDRAIQVRVNPIGTPDGDKDLQMVDELPSSVGVRVPKVDSPRRVHDVVRQLRVSRAVHCLVESAAGVEHAFDIAQAHHDVASLAVGEADLRSQLGPAAPQLLAWCRMRVVLAARAAGLPAPMQSVWTAVHDHAGLARSCAVGRAEGFVGRAAIHPAQLPVIRDAYRPSPEDVRRAREVLDRLAAARQDGDGVSVSDDGEFLDRAMIDGARHVLALAASTNVGDARMQ